MKLCFFIDNITHTGGIEAHPTNWVGEGVDANPKLGSPNIIREALFLNKPVFSVNVGDAAKQLERLHNSAIISREPKEAIEQIKLVILRTYTDNTRETLQD